MDNRSSCLELKVVVLGDRGVGKTSLALRFVEGTYTNNYQPTIGAFFLSKRMVTRGGIAFKMQLWDTAGQERFRAMAPMYYRNAAAAIVCFDITSEESFVMMKDWVAELKNHFAGQSLVLVIAATKLDLEAERAVSLTRAIEYGSEVGARVFETSSKDNTGIDELFLFLCEEMTGRIKQSLAANHQQSTTISKNSSANSPCC